MNIWSREPSYGAKNLIEQVSPESKCVNMKELRGFRDDLTQPKVQPILSRAIYSVLLHVGSFDVVQRVSGRSRMCGCSA